MVHTLEVRGLKMLRPSQRDNILAFHVVTHVVVFRNWQRKSFLNLLPSRQKGKICQCLKKVHILGEDVDSAKCGVAVPVQRARRVVGCWHKGAANDILAWHMRVALIHESME